MLVRTLVLGGLVAFSAVPAWAQPADQARPAVLADESPASESRFQIRAYGAVGIPVGEFGDHVDLSGGLGAGFGYRLGSSPVRLGGQVTWLQYGSQTRLIPLSLTIPDVLVRVKTSSHIVNAHATVRVQPVSGRVRPYAEALVGLSDVFTQTSVDLSRGPFQNGAARTTNLNSVAFSSGAGGGVMVGLASGWRTRLDFDVELRYVYNGEGD